MRRAWTRSSFACLTARTLGISASSTIVSGSMLTTTRARNVVDDDRPVADVGDRAEVLDDASGGGLVVVRRDDEEPVYTELVRFSRQVDGVGGGVGAGAGDDGRPAAERVDGDPEQLEPLVVRERWALPGRPRDDDPV